jgi:fumarate hydratase class I
MDTRINPFELYRSPHLSVSDAEWQAYQTLQIQPIAAQDISDTLAAMVAHGACNLPEDFVRALRFGFDREKSPLGRSIYRQLLENAVAASQAGRPSCQDTGQAVVFIDIGQNVRLIGGNIHDAVQEGIARGYKTLRASIVADALFNRKNTGNNTPAILHTRLVPGHSIEIQVAQKGYGSENKSFMTMYPYPQGGEEAVEKFVCEMISKAGADWCPPGMLSIAVGGNFETAPLMAKRALLEPFDMDIILNQFERDPAALSARDRLRVRLFDAVNRIGIGPQGLGGFTTVLDVKLTTAPTHIAGLPIAVNVQCSKAHHIASRLDGHGPVTQFARSEFLPYLAGLETEHNETRRVTLPFQPEVLATLRAGERLLLSGTILTGRDAAHKRMIETLDRKEPLPVDLKGQCIYYVGPVDPRLDEIVGSAGPTTSSRMDPYAPRLFREQGLAATIGKSEIGDSVIAAIRETGGIYMIATGGAGFLQSKTITKVDVLAYADLGTEAIRRFEVQDFPVIVAVDSHGGNLHRQGRLAYQTNSGKTNAPGQ